MEQEVLLCIESILDYLANHFRLSSKPTSTWSELFLRNWNYPPSFTSMHRPGIARVESDKIILDGTTIEEVKQYHRDTLILCVEKTNEEEKQYRRREEEKNN